MIKRIFNTISKWYNAIVDSITLWVVYILLILFFITDKIHNTVNSVWKWISTKLLKWNEFIAVPIGMLMTRWSEKVVTYFYPGSTRYDVGFYYDIIYSIGTMFIIHGFAYGFFKMNWFMIEKYLDTDLDVDFANLTGFQRIAVALWLFNSYLFGFIATFFSVSSASIK